MSISGNRGTGFTITLESNDINDYTAGTVDYNLKVTYTKPGGTSPIVFLDPFTIEIDKCLPNLNAPSAD